MQHELPATVSHFNFVDLVSNADPIVQAVMFVLVLASICCWAIIFEKIIRLLGFVSQVRRFEQAAASRPLEEGESSGLTQVILKAARCQDFSADESRADM